MTGPDPHQAPLELPGGGHPSWRRRQFVVDPRYQLRAGVLVGSVAIALLVVLNASLIAQNRWNSRTQDIQVARPQATVTGTNRVSWILLLAGSGVFLAGVIAVGVLESHRTAGAAYAIRRSIEQIREGRAGVRVRLRRGDHLQDLAKAINELAESLDAERSRHG